MKNIVILDRIFKGTDWKTKAITDDVVCRCLVCGGEKVMSIKQALKYYEHRDPEYNKVPICDNCTSGKVARNGLIPQSIKSDISNTTMKEIYAGFEDVVAEYFSNEMSTTVYATKCSECGKNYYDTYNMIVKKGLFRCASCYKKGVRAERLRYKSLREMVPNIEKYWSEKNEKQPSDIHLCKTSRDKFFINCSLCGKEVHKIYRDILRSGPYCKSCVRRVNVDKEKTLRYLYPVVADMYDNSERNKLPSDMISYYAKGKFYFKCVNCGEVFKTNMGTVITALERSNSSSCGCTVCRGFEIRKGVNDISCGANPWAEEMWDLDKNVESRFNVSYKSKRFYWFRCPKGHSFQATPFRILQGYIGNKSRGRLYCPVCSGREVVSGVNDIVTTHKDCLKYWDYEKNNELGIFPENVSHGSSKHIYALCSVCGSSYETTVSSLTSGDTVSCENCRKRNYSIAEKELVQYIRDLGFTVEEEIRIAGNYSVDMVIPEKGIAIDYNGLYWHSERYRESWYHKWKIDLCKEETGLELYYIWEDDYQNKREIVLSWVRNLLGVSNSKKVNARDCIIDETILGNEGETFLNGYHIQGSAGAMCRYLGLRTSDGELVALMGYIYNTDGVNIVRYCTSCNVRGGFSKLLSHLEYISRAEGYDTVYTFSDNSISRGGLYKSCGFTVSRELKPDYSYLAQGIRVHKFNYRKSRFKKDPMLFYDEDMTEKELAEINGLERIYDSGKIRWVKFIT